MATPTKSDDAAEESAPPSLYLHCVDVYSMMMKHATRQLDEEGEDIIVYQGMLTKLITGEMHLSVPYYTHITQALKRMGCIKQLRRGGGTAPSLWQLIHDPQEELFEKTAPRKVPKQDRNAQMAGQLAALNRRVLALEELLEHIIKEEERHGEDDV